MLTKGLFTSTTDEWSTPQDFFDRLDKEFHFELDVCANHENHKCAKYFTKADDGLSMTWGGGCYMVQSTVWSRDWQVGGKVRRTQWHGCYVVACSHRYKVVP